MSTERPHHRIGRLGSPNGLKGFIGVYMEDADAELLQPGSQLFVEGVSKEIRALRRGDKGWQIAFVEHLDRASVEALRGGSVEVSARRLLDDDEYWPDQLIGLAVVDVDGRRLGEVSDVVNGPAQDRLVIRTPGGEHDVPLVKELVPEIDMAEGVVRIVTLDGLLSEPGPPQ